LVYAADGWRHGAQSDRGVADLAGVWAGAAPARAVEFKKFLQTIDSAVPSELEVHLILDNYATHKTPAIQRWLLAHPRFVLHFTPTGLSWLNLVERWFAELTRRMIKRGSGAYLTKFGLTRIYRHQMVRGTASADDPALADYWAERRRKAPLLPIGNAGLRLYEAQHGRCPLCRGPLLPDEDLPQSLHEWEHWQATIRKTITTITMREDGTSDQTKPRLVHHRCHQRHTTANGNGPALLSAREPSGLA
jgi:transposase